MLLLYVALLHLGEEGWKTERLLAVGEGSPFLRCTLHHVVEPKVVFESTGIRTLTLGFRFGLFLVSVWFLLAAAPPSAAPGPVGTKRKQRMIQKETQAPSKEFERVDLKQIIGPTIMKS